MARIWLLWVMVGALGLVGAGTSVSRSATVSLSIPPITVLSLPHREISGKELRVEITPADLAQGFLLLPLEVKSNVPWAVTAQVLSEGRAELVVEVMGGPEVMVTTEEVPILAGRPGKHETLLRVKFSNLAWAGGTLVFRVAGWKSESPQG